MTHIEEIKAMQTALGLDADGIVGKSTWEALRGGFTPPLPPYAPLMELGKKRLFGDPTGGRRISATGDGTFEPVQDFRDQLVRVDVPGWFCGRGWVLFHKLAADPLVRLLKAWETAGVYTLVKSFGGTVAFRNVRGGTTLSSHAFGTAFDINVAWNPLGKRPAMPWEHGTVLGLVSIANADGWYWGGHFTRLDGMHFERARL